MGAHSRLITIEKSRSGRMGTQLVMQMQDDLSFTISDFTPEVDETNTSPASVTDRVLQKLRVVYPESRTKDDLVCDALIDGKPAAIHKSLQRLETVSYTHLRAHETRGNLVCRLLLEKKKKKKK